MMKACRLLILAVAPALALRAPVSRRVAIGSAAVIAVGARGRQALAADKPVTVFVAGATGQTGRRVLERLAAVGGGVEAIGGVRNVASAEKSLAESSTVVRGAMVQKVGSLSTPVKLAHLDVVEDSVDAIAATLKGSEYLVIATGFVPGNPFKMDSAAHAVDNLGTIALISAAKQAGVKKVVLVSSILTNGRAWGQEKSPGFQITNAFGHVLDEKIVAENFLKQSGLDFTIVRPGGLKASAASGALLVSKEDTLNSGEVSRDLVADVCVAALFDAKAKNQVVEIIESTTEPPNAAAKVNFL